MSYRWYFGDQNDPVILEGHTGDFPNTTVGETFTFEFYIQDDVISDDNFDVGTLTYTTAIERYNRVKDYLQYAGYANTNTTLESAYFTEPGSYSNAPISSLLVPIWPHSDIDQARGIWGVITGGDDTTEIFGAVARVSIDVFVLAEYSDYATETDVRNAFERSL